MKRWRRKGENIEEEKVEKKGGNMEEEKVEKKGGGGNIEDGY